jgi:hypothetical protein
MAGLACLPAVAGRWPDSPFMKVHPRCAY